MKFIDEAVIFIKAGDGGNGCVSFSRTRHNPKGGPDGGDGGKGGNIVFRSSGSRNTLIDFKFKDKYIAPNGANGKGQDMTGADGADLVISVPPGTVIKKTESGEVIADLNRAGMDVIVLSGGRGGKGNAKFCTASRQSPTFAESGEKTEGMRVGIELKLLADAGLVGLPNAGKSTIISRISSARPKIADYPFTTLVPNLGVVKYDNVSFVVADIPGLIENAHQGSGLGIRFLKHIERTRVLLHIVDLSPEQVDPVANIKTINSELANFSGELSGKRMFYVLNKTDVADIDTLYNVEKYMRDNNYDYVAVSAVTGHNMDELLKKTVFILGEVNV
ncbi:MAG: GTPase ObgE [Oligoflexia bacterium]|nr:GTPase ObgE [Oligoflexia bacterium]